MTTLNALLRKPSVSSRVKVDPHDAIAYSPLLWALSVAVPLHHPTRGEVRFVPYRYQEQLLADRSPMRMVLKSRQTGVSQTLAVETAHAALYKPNSTHLWLSKDQDAASQALGYVKTALYGVGARLVKDQEQSIKLANGSRVVSLAASPSSGRSFAATSVYLDEFAFAHYHQQLFTAVAPTTSQGGRLTVVSTPNGRANTFFLLWSGQGGGEWSRHTIHWRDCPVYDETWYAVNRPRYTAAQWAQEFECDFVTSGLARFSPADIERAHEGATGVREPMDGEEYVTAWDIGRRRDATVGVTLTTRAPFQVVAFERLDGWSYPRIQRAIEARAARWTGVTYVESNGVGDPVIENLTTGVVPHVTSAKSKLQALDALTLLLERGDIKWTGLAQLDAEMLVYQDDDKDLVQDCVMALSMAAAHLPQAAGSLWAWDEDVSYDD